METENPSVCRSFRKKKHFCIELTAFVDNGRSFFNATSLYALVFTHHLPMLLASENMRNIE